MDKPTSLIWMKLVVVPEILASIFDCESIFKYAHVKSFTIEASQLKY